MGVCLEPAVC